MTVSFLEKIMLMNKLEVCQKVMVLLGFLQTFQSMCYNRGGNIPMILAWKSLVYFIHIMPFCKSYIIIHLFMCPCYIIACCFSLLPAPNNIWGHWAVQLAKARALYKVFNNKTNSQYSFLQFAVSKLHQSQEILIQQLNLLVLVLPQ